jgi:hypothetical protein
VGFGVDATGETRHDRQTASGEFPAESTSLGASGPGGRPSTDDRDRRRIQDSTGSTDEKHRRCINESRKAHRISRIREGQDVGTHFVEYSTVPLAEIALGLTREAGESLRHRGF